MRKPGQRVTWLGGVPFQPRARQHCVALNNASVAYQHRVGRLRVHTGANAEFTGENMMHLTAQTKTRASARPRRVRPNSAPAYYLGRPASFWIAATARHAGTPDAGRKAA